MSVRRLKARKARYGFEIKFSANLDDLLTTLDFIKNIKDYEESVSIEYNQNMAGVDTVKIYTDEDTIGKYLEYLESLL